ncbi:hypothetical protein KIH74_34880 [Kineosporia sp. J2-2]|uniref:Integral membrane protein n=1 Tax=Kineosporia corallincola TaxID=2835133 RepID=A0ABS5TTP3_9ACTN|nr:pilin [Kineosporia corallincola]MBT0774183.1 hypothetical protein [Kineosporia corallincola]
MLTVAVVVPLAVLGALVVVLAAVCSVNRCLAPEPASVRPPARSVQAAAVVVPAAGHGIGAGQMIPDARALVPGREVVTAVTVQRSQAQQEPGDPGQAQDLPTVIGNATTWLRGIAATLTVLMLTVAGITRTFAREPGDMDKARTALVGACAGFAITLLAPQIVDILRGILGVSGG